MCASSSVLRDVDVNSRSGALFFGDVFCAFWEDIASASAEWAPRAEWAHALDVGHWGGADHWNTHSGQTHELLFVSDGMDKRGQTGQTPRSLFRQAGTDRMRGMRPRGRDHSCHYYSCDDRCAAYAEARECVRVGRECVTPRWVNERIGAASFFGKRVCRDQAGNACVSRIKTPTARQPATVVVYYDSPAYLYHSDDTFASLPGTQICFRSQ
jgi:hypothetical protein